MGKCASKLLGGYLYCLHIFDFSPLQESIVSVCFDPPLAPLIAEGRVRIQIQPGGPVYELKLRGTATEPSTPSKG